MHEPVIDLRSDTVTCPVPEMRAAMQTADVGDDVYGEDPTVNKLEMLVSAISGKEAALFVPSGSMANMIAHLVYPVRGDEVIVGEQSHCIKHEAGAVSLIAGCFHQVVAGRPIFDADALRDRINPPDFHSPATKLVWVENTHNMSGGRVFPLEDLMQIRKLCREFDLPLHMDGARLFNAAVATGYCLSDLVDPVDSFSICLSKGLGAPVGSVLAGKRTFIEKALRWRKRLGGGMRQAGILAAAGIYALQNHIERLAEDHENARRLARALQGIEGLQIECAEVETNIVMATTAMEASLLAKHCARRGVLFHALGRHTARFVTHMGLDAEAIDEASRIIEEVAAG